MNKKSVRFSTLVTMALLLWLTVLSSDSVLATPSTEGGVVISEVQITNVRDAFVTISWITDQETTGSVQYGTNPANLNQTANDDRGAATSDDTHYVTISSLSPETTYYFDVVSGSTTDNNGGSHYSFTTGPTLSVPGSDTIFGQVFKEDGTTFAEGAIVYITLQDNDASGDSGKAAPLSALVGSDGYWFTNLGNARLSDLSDYFSYSASGDQVLLDAQGAADGIDDETIDTANDTPAADMTLGPVIEEPAELRDVIYVSSSSSGSVDGITFADEDILTYDQNTGIWSQFFDGSDVGLSGTDVDAFVLMDDGSILMSFDTDIGIPTGMSEEDEQPVIEDDEALLSQESQSSFHLPDVGAVTDSDIVRFTPTALGKTTAGSFSLYLTGSSVGLTTGGEDIDAIGFTPQGDLVISTLGSFSVTGASGGDEDLASYDGSSWARYFDASDVQLTASTEDVAGTWIDSSSGEIYFTTLGNLSAGGITGDKADIFSCLPSSTGTNTACTMALYWDGSEHGFGTEVVDAISLAPAPAESLYVSSSSGGGAGGITFADEDILSYDQKNGVWSMFFDGSDVGIGGTDVDAFTIMDDGSILMSFDTDIGIPTGMSEEDEQPVIEDDEALLSQESQSTFLLPGVGAVTDSDIVRFTPTALGNSTAGSFSLYLTGSTVGLTTGGEDIDAIGFTPQGDLVISTLGSFSVSGASGADEDLVRYDGSSWALYLDGSDVQLNASTEDISGTWIDPKTGQLYFTTLGNVSARGITGDKADIFGCTPGSLGSTTTCSFVRAWDGSENGFGPEVVDAFALSLTPSVPEVIYVSSSSSGSVDGITFADEDILTYDQNTGVWSQFFDGSDVGLSGTDVDAFVLMDDGSILMSFDTDIGIPTGMSEEDEQPIIEDDEALLSQESQSSFHLPDVGAVTDSDIVRFTPTALGKTTAGSFSLYLTGSSVGLTTGGEDIDAIGFTPQGDLVISTLGSYSVTGASGTDEDLVRYDGSSWAIYFDGSDVQLTASTEDTTGTWIDSSSGEIYFTVLGNLSAGGITGDKADIFSCLPSSTGNATACSMGLYWDGSEHGFGTEVVDAISLAPAPAENLYVSSSSGGNAGGITFADEDILSYDQKNGVWSLFFDGSDVGIGGTDVDAFTIMDDGSILMSFDTDIGIPTGMSEDDEQPVVEDDEALLNQESQSTFLLPDVGAVTDSDIVRFTPTSLGETTAGSFSLYLTGSTVGLTTGGEDIDAIGFTPEGDLVISTLGSFSVSGASGADEDLVSYDGSSWALYLDGSDVQLTASNEDIIGTWIDSSGKVYFTTLGNVSARGITGDKADIFGCTPGSLGSTTTCSFVRAWDGSEHGFGAEVVDAFAITVKGEVTQNAPVYELDHAPTSIALASLSTPRPEFPWQSILLAGAALVALGGYGVYRRQK